MHYLSKVVNRNNICFKKLISTPMYYVIRDIYTLSENRRGMSDIISVIHGII